MHCAGQDETMPKVIDFDAKIIENLKGIRKINDNKRYNEYEKNNSYQHNKKNNSYDILMIKIIHIIVL